MLVLFYNKRLIIFAKIFVNIVCYVYSPLLRDHVFHMLLKYSNIKLNSYTIYQKTFHGQLYMSCKCNEIIKPLIGDWHCTQRMCHHIGYLIFSFLAKTLAFRLDLDWIIIRTWRPGLKPVKMKALYGTGNKYTQISSKSTDVYLYLT